MQWCNNSLTKCGLIIAYGFIGKASDLQLFSLNANLEFESILPIAFKVTSMALGKLRTATVPVNKLRPRQNGCHLTDDIFKCIFLNDNVWISIKILLKFAPKGSVNSIPALAQIMAWGRLTDKPLSEPMMVNLLTHICITWPQWIKQLNMGK